MIGETETEDMTTGMTKRTKQMARQQKNRQRKTTRKTSPRYGAFRCSEYGHTQAECNHPKRNVCHATVPAMVGLLPNPITMPGQIGDTTVNHMLLNSGLEPTFPLSP